MKRFLFILGLLGVFFSFQSVNADPGSWTSRTSAVDNQWTSVTHGNGLFVAVSQSGIGNRVMTSPDGINWTSRTSAVDNLWTSVTYGDGLFVVVAQSGTGNRVMTSPDGINWTSRTSAADNAWYSVTYGNGLFVAVSGHYGSTSQVMTSPDGITWTLQVTNSISKNYYWNSVTYGNGLFVAVGGFYSDSFPAMVNKVMTSPDGINWTAIGTPTGIYNWKSVTYGNGLFVAVSNYGTGNRVMTSPDGINWTSRITPLDNFWTSLTYGDGFFVAVSATGTGNRVMTSPDGINWTSGTSAVDNGWNSVTYGNGKFVAVAVSGIGNRVMTSDYSVTPPPSAPTLPAGPHTTFTPSYIYNVQCVSAGTLYEKVGTSPDQSIGSCTAGQIFSRTANFSTLGAITISYKVQASDSQWSSYGSISINRQAPRDPTIDITTPLTTHHSSITYNITCVDGGNLYEDNEVYQACTSGQVVSITKPLTMGSHTWQYEVRQDEVGFTYSLGVQITRVEPTAPIVPANPQEPTSQESFTFQVTCTNGGALYEKIGTSPAQFLQNCTDDQVIEYTRGLNLGNNLFTYYVRTADGIESDYVSFTKYRDSSYIDKPAEPIILNTVTDQTTKPFTLQVKSNSDDTQIFCDWNQMGFEEVGGIIANGVTVTKDYSLIYAGNEFYCYSEKAGKKSSSVFFSVSLVDELIVYKAPVLISPPTLPLGTTDSQFSVVVESQENGSLYCNNSVTTKNLGQVIKGQRKTYTGAMLTGQPTTVFICFTRVQESPMKNSPFLTLTIYKSTPFSVSAPVFIDQKDEGRTSSSPYGLKIKSIDSGELFCKFRGGTYQNLGTLTVNQEFTYSLDFSQFEDLSKPISVDVACYTKKNGVGSAEVETLIMYNPYLYSCIRYNPPIPANYDENTEQDEQKKVNMTLLGAFGDLWNFIMTRAIVGDYAWINCLMKNQFIDNLKYPTDSSYFMTFDIHFLNTDQSVAVDVLKPIGDLQTSLINNIGQDSYDTFRWFTTSLLIFSALWGIWSTMALAFISVKNDGLAYNNSSFNKKDL